MHGVNAITFRNREARHSSQIEKLKITLDVVLVYKTLPYPLYP